jgi:hypothetical protein
MTSAAVEAEEIILSVGDTTYLDYGNIKAKREGYRPEGNGGNGLILHSAIAFAPEQGQVIGLLWQKLWNREPKAKPAKDETPEVKKQRQTLARKVARQRSFKDKESYRWVEAMTEVEHQVSSSTRVIHIFDREGDITEVFEQVRQLRHTGVLVSAAHDRSLDANSERLWQKLDALPRRFEQEIKVPEAGQRKARVAKLAVRFSKVQLRVPDRFDNRDPLQVYGVYATEIDCPEGETSLEWMLLTTEVVEDLEMAITILRCYTYRWRVQDFHEIFKSGCQCERYRLAAEGVCQ